MLATERNQETTKNVQENFVFFFFFFFQKDVTDSPPPKKEDDRQLAIYNKAKEHLYTHNTPINFEKGKKKKGKRSAAATREKKK